MGTSKGYSLPTGGDWTPLKREATQFAHDQGRGPISPLQLLRDYVRANGGAQGLAGPGGSAGGAGGSRSRRPGAAASGHAARAVGANLGGFLSTVQTSGLDTALRQIGLGHLVGRTAEDVTAALLNALTNPGGTLDEHAARLALARLNDDILREAHTYEDLAAQLTRTIDADGITQILAAFFGHYLYERFCRDFYEGWVKRVGAATAARLLKSVRDCITSSLKAKLRNRDATRMNWRGKEGLRLTEQVMRETLEIFSVVG